MPSLSGIFSQFIVLDQVPLTDINRWLKVKAEPHVLQNYIGNRLLYPQTVSQTEQEMEIDFAILREIIKRKPEIIYKKDSKRLFLPGELVDRFPPHAKLITAILDVMVFPSYTQIILLNKLGNETLGTIMTYDNRSGKKTEVTVTIDNEPYKCLTGTIAIIPASKKNITFQYDGQDPLIINGGKLGIVLDLR